MADGVLLECGGTCGEEGRVCVGGVAGVRGGVVRGWSWAEVSGGQLFSATSDVSNTTPTATVVVTSVKTI